MYARLSPPRKRRKTTTTKKSGAGAALSALVKEFQVHQKHSIPQYMRTVSDVSHLFWWLAYKLELLQKIIELCEKSGHRSKTPLEYYRRELDFTKFQLVAITKKNSHCELFKIYFDGEPAALSALNSYLEVAMADKVGQSSMPSLSDLLFTCMPAYTRVFHGSDKDLPPATINDRPQDPNHVLPGYVVPSTPTLFPPVAAEDAAAIKEFAGTPVEDLVESGEFTLSQVAEALSPAATPTPTEPGTLKTAVQEFIKNATATEELISRVTAIARKISTLKAPTSDELNSGSVHLALFNVIEECRHDQHELIAYMTSPENCQAFNTVEVDIQKAVADTLQLYADQVWVRLRELNVTVPTKYKVTWERKTPEEEAKKPGVSITMHLPAEPYDAAKIDRASFQAAQDAAKPASQAVPTPPVLSGPTEPVMVIVDRAELHKMKLAGVRLHLITNGRTLKLTTPCMSMSPEYLAALKGTVKNAALTLL